MDVVSSQSPSCYDSLYRESDKMQIIFRGACYDHNVSYCATEYHGAASGLGQVRQQPPEDTKMVL